MDHDAPQLLTVAPVRLGETCLIRLSGELDMASVLALREAISGPLLQGVRRLVIDLGGLTFIDSAGVHALEAVARIAQAQQMQLGLRPGTPDVQRVFEIVGADATLPFVA